MNSSTNFVHSTFTAGAGASLLCSGEGDLLQPASAATVAASDCYERQKTGTGLHHVRNLIGKMCTTKPR